jgi:NAD(P)H-dependent FMN reductase
MIARGPVRILVFAGSARQGSWNKKLAALAARRARHGGAEVTLLDLAAFPMPIYDGDIEEEMGLPEHAKKFKEAVIAHDAIIIASPEYNGSFTPLLKNAIDWATRREQPSEPPVRAFKGKAVALLSASTGAFGGMRGLIALRILMSAIRCQVLPDQLSVPKADQAFSPEGELIDPMLNARLDEILANLVQLTACLKR